MRRVVDPLGLVHKTGAWYLVAARDGEMRVYRVDRVRAVGEVDGEVDGAVRRPDGFDLARFWEAWEADYAARLPTFAARVRLGPIGRRYKGALGAVAPRAATAEEPDGEGWVRQTLTFDDRRSAVAALLALAPDVEVLEPEELRAELAATARALIERNG